MPGRKLSHDEQRVLDFWENPPANFDRPLLRQLRVEGGPGLRGIQRLVVPFPYPLTAICGRNGVGKSTILALAALSAQPPDDWLVYWGNTRPRTRPNVRARYEFGDFFHRTGGAAPFDGITLSWVLMDHGNEIEVAKRCIRGRWVRVVDVARHAGAGALPAREIDYVPVSRILPAIEHGVMRSAFSGPVAGPAEALNPEHLSILSYVMGREYTEVSTGLRRGLRLASCHAGAAYSGFDMGAGESSVIVILSRLQAARTGSLVVIEELELGLHAEAQARLVEVLIRACGRRRLQVICTTHSEVILDSLPRQARVLLRKNGDEHEAIGNVSTRFAVHEMAGHPHPELVVYTEDRFAAVMVEEALTGPRRIRVDVRDIGSSATLARQAVSHLRFEAQLRALSVFDGDCTAAQVNAWIRGERGERDINPEWLILPADGLNPEHWVVRELSGADYLANLAGELDCTLPVAASHVEAMRVQLDNHNCGYVLAQRTGIEEIAARRMLVRSVARRHPGLEPLRNRIEELLDR